MFWFKKAKRITYQELPEKVRETLEQTSIPGQDRQICIRKLREIARKYPGFITASLNLGVMLLESGDITEARRVYEQVAADWPDEYGAIAGLATVCEAEGKNEEAEKLAEQTIEKGYKWTPCYGIIAKAREARGDIEGAAKTYLEGYQLSPHAWNCLREYCRLTKRSFTPPDKKVELFISVEQLESLANHIENCANKVEADGKQYGCDHTFRFTNDWSDKNNIDRIALYQLLNAHGGFCDCEVCYNVMSSVSED